MKKIALNSKIEILQERVAKDMDETSYQELINLKNKAKSG